MKRFGILLTISIAAIFVGLSATSAWRESLTYDEIVHIEEGITAWTKREFRVDTNNPPLTRELAVIPLLLSGSSLKTAGAPNRIVFASRMIILLLGAVLLSFVFIEGKRMFGSIAAATAIFLFAFEPSMLAHSHYITQDMGAALFFFLAYMSLIHLLNKPSWKMFIIHGVCVGCMAASKITTLPFYSVCVLLIVPYSLRGHMLSWFSTKPTQIIVSVFTCLLVVWMTYFFTTNVVVAPSDAQGRVSATVRSFARRTHNYPLLGFMTFLESQPIPLGDYIAVLKNTAIRATRPQSTFFMGSYYPRPRWYFMLANFFFKTPLPLLLFAILGAVIGLTSITTRKNTLIILVPVFSIFLVSAISSMQPLIRYILPMYPFLFLLGGLPFKLLNQRLFRLLFGLCMLWYVGATLVSYPHFLTYANERAGPIGKRYEKFTDSNIDWGQGLLSLKTYIDQEKPSLLRLSYFGRDNAAAYGLLSTTPFGSYKSNEICAFHDMLLPGDNGKVLSVISVSNWRECGFSKDARFSRDNIHTVVTGSFLVFTH